MFLCYFCENTNAQMPKYEKYQSDIKTCCALGIQNEILPEKFIREIPGSTSHYWKHENFEKYVGGEFSKSIQNNLENTEVFLDSHLYFSRKAFIQFARIYIVLISDRKFACNLSLVGQCFKRRPNQISNKEISILKKYMNLSKHKIWCIRSIWGKAIRDGVVSMAESTWYRYARKLGYSEIRKPQKKPRKKGSFNASRPNETWHMDISQYKTLDNVTFYIYTVVDNFSRKILAWDISTKKCAKIRTETVKQAIKNEFSVDLKDQNLELIVDGGSENNNKTISGWRKTVIFVVKYQRN